MDPIPSHPPGKLALIARISHPDVAEDMKQPPLQSPRAILGMSPCYPLTPRSSTEKMPVLFSDSHELMKSILNRANCSEAIWNVTASLPGFMTRPFPAGKPARICWHGALTA